MKMIDNATTNSYRRSIDLYGKAVTNGIISYEADMVEKGQKIDITFENIDSYIEYEGNDVDCKDKTIYSDKTILLTECYVQEELVYGEKGKGYDNENYYYYTNSRKKMKVIKYIEAVEEALEGKSINGTCQVQEDKIVCNNEEITIKSKLENAIEGNLIIENNKVKSYNNLKFATEKKTETNNEVPQVIDEQNTSTENNNIQNQEKYVILVSDADNDGEVSIGDKYTYKVNDTDTFNFYVLSIEDDKVNLIMDRNICEDGLAATDQNLCFYAWYDEKYGNYYGPRTVLPKLYNATKNWINTPDMELDYFDEGFHNWKIETKTNEIRIISDAPGVPQDESLFVIPYDSGKTLKSRLPKKSEITSLCNVFASCPAWLTNALQEYQVIYPNNEHVINIHGYWTFSSDCNTGGAFVVHYYGSGNECASTSNDSEYGIRPVITVSMSYLTN